MPKFLTTYYDIKGVGLSNYLKSLFSTYRLNQFYNPQEFSTCVDKERDWIFKSFFDNPEFIHTELIESTAWYHYSNDFLPPTDLDRPFWKTEGWRFYLHPSDNVNTKPFKNEWFLREQSNSIDFRYTNIPQNIRGIYLDVISKFKIKSTILEWVDLLSKELGQEVLGVHIRTWKTFGDLSDNRSSEFRYSYYLSNLELLINTINKSPYDKVLICTDNQEEVNNIIPHLNKEIYWYRKNPELTDLENDFCELLLLSKSESFIGSNNSTFSELVWWYGGCEENIDII